MENQNDSQTPKLPSKHTEPSEFFINIAKALYSGHTIFMIDEEEFILNEIDYILEMNDRSVSPGEDFFIKLIQAMSLIFTDLSEEDKSDMPYLKDIFLRVSGNCKTLLSTYNDIVTIELNCNYSLDILNDRFRQEGIAELARQYFKNGHRIYQLKPFNKSNEKDMLAPIVARGITAFLSPESDFMFGSFRSRLRSKSGPDSEPFLEEYFNHCMKFLRKNEKKRTPIVKKRKSEIQLIRDHYDSEQKILSEPQSFYTEIIDEAEKQIIKTIREVAEYYLEWLSEYHLNKYVKELPAPADL